MSGSRYGLSTPTTLSARVPQPYRIALIILLVAVVFRAPFVYATLRQPGFNWRWGGEMFSIANAIVSGEGFSSPYGLATGATAQQTPAFPYLVAVLYYVGNGSMEVAARILLGLNAVFSALTCLVLIAIGNRLRPGHGHAFGWAWAIFPILGYSEVKYLWDTALYTLVLTTLLWLLLTLRGKSRSVHFVCLGLGAGASLLLDPAHLLVLGLILVAFYVFASLTFRNLAITAGAVALVVAPWIIRNSLVFGHPMFIRSNIGYETYRGLTASPSEPEMASALNPGRNPAQLALYQRLGEYRYMALQSRLAKTLIIRQPSLVLRRIGTRSTAFWIGNSEVNRNPWPVGIFLKHALFAVPALAALWGLRVFWRDGVNHIAALSLTIVVLVFPLPYYLTLTVPRYRAPIEPTLVFLGVYGLLPRRWKSATPSAV
jgi:hypothetical protein